MKKLLLVVLCLFIGISCAFARGQATQEMAGNGFDGGRVLISSCAVKRSGQTTWSMTDSVFDEATYTNTINNKWLAKNKGPYEVLVDSCIWTDHGSWAILNDTNTPNVPYIWEDEEKNWLNAKTRNKTYMRALTATTGWSTFYFMRTFDE